MNVINSAMFMLFINISYFCQYLDLRGGLLTFCFYKGGLIEEGA